MSSSSVSSLPKEAEVSRMLEGLKREPVDTQGSQDALLAPIYTLLMSAPPNEDDILHWFCDKARPVVVEASIFLLRLHAYSANIRVDSWKAKMRGVLHGCCGCVQGYANAKVSSRDTYVVRLLT
jgi:ATP-dependent RNA/DNA helicase, senataxin